MSPTVKAIAYGVVSLAVFSLAAVCACRAMLSPTGCHAREGTTAAWLRGQLADARAYMHVLAGDIAHWPPVRAASERLRWKLWGLLTRSRRVCAANAHGALIWRTRPLREILVDDMCRQDCALNGVCWCGNLRDDDKLRERAAAACASPDGTASDPPSEAVPLELCDRGPDHPPWITAGNPRLPEMLQ